MQCETEKGQSAVQFAGDARLHVSFPVSSLEHSIAFYTLLFQERPSKIRPDYAKFEPASPSVNLSMYQKPDGVQRHSGHFGVQVKNSAAVLEAKKRFQEAGLAIREEEGVNCCYAIQDKFWASDPDGNEWEVFVVLDNDAPHEDAAKAMSACCSSGNCQ